jgi:hypothetical protein
MADEVYDGAIGIDLGKLTDLKSAHNMYNDFGVMNY